VNEPKASDRLAPSEPKVGDRLAPSEPKVGELPVTPSQTVGPFFAIGLPWRDGPDVVADGTPGAITITGRVTDGHGDPVPDALVETWQAAPDGSFGHPDDPRTGARASPGPPACRRFGRCPTDDDGRYRIRTLRPPPLPTGDGGTEAPHIDVSVFARGLLDRLVTRIYFPDEEAANAADPVLSQLNERLRRATLVAQPQSPGVFRFDIRLQGEGEHGEGETVFFDV
jgi:protocatechuate 3,4-dioxygenase alpha subunit